MRTSTLLQSGVVCLATLQHVSAAALHRRVNDATLTQYDPAIQTALASSGSRDVPLGNTTFTCQALEIALGNNDTLVSAADDQSAYTAQEDINYAPTCWLPAACIAVPQSVEEVARVVQILNQTQTTFAIRSGGHLVNPGFASVNGSGVLLSLSNITTLSLSYENSTLTVGPGLRWQAVYDYIVPLGLGVVGGRVGTVGVGGCLLGGCMSYLTNEHGLGIDNIASFEVVLASGDVVTASATENSNLYKALRGGSSNFGVVTGYALRTHALGSLNWEVRAYAASNAAAVLEAFAAWQLDGLTADPLSRVDLTVTNEAAEVLLLYNEAAYYPAAFDAFYNLSAEYTTVVGPVNGSFIDLLELENLSFSTAHPRAYGETFSHTVNATFMVEAQEIFAAATANLSSVTAAWVPVAVPASVADSGDDNVLGLEAVPQQWHEWSLTWDDAADDEAIFALADSITAQLTAAAEEAGTLLPYIFMNTAGRNQKVLAGFGEDNVDYIKQVAEEYDPTGLFQKQFNGNLIRRL